MTERSYEYPAKNRVRELWFEFLEQSGVHKNAHGLYLPGSQNLEFEGYRRLGVKPNQLIGCEHDPDILPEVRRHAQGIQVVSGSVADGVAHAKRQKVPRLSFANLDFDGMYDTFVEQIFSLFHIFPTSPAGCLAITSYSARDDMCIAQGTANICKFYAALGDQVRFLSDIGTIVSRWRDGKRLMGSGVPDHTYVSRELGLLWWLVMAMMVVTQGDGTYATIDRGFLDSVSARLAKLTKQVTRASKRIDIAFTADELLVGLLAKRRVSLWPTDFQHIIYYSHGSQPMRTWFVRICTMKRGQPTAQELVMQMWQLALRAPLTYVDDTGNVVRFN